MLAALLLPAHADAPAPVPASVLPATPAFDDLESAEAGRSLPAFLARLGALLAAAVAVLATAAALLTSIPG
jgi:hypothetical protein